MYDVFYFSEKIDCIEDDVLAKIADVLKVPVEAIKNFDDRGVVNIVSNSFDDNSIAYQPIFNPIDRVVELYERMMKEKDGQIELLKSLLASK